jgi:hypothetical protein
MEKGLAVDTTIFNWISQGNSTVGLFQWLLHVLVRMGPSSVSSTKMSVTKVKLSP